MNIAKYENTLLNTKAFKYLNSKELDIIKGYCNIISFKKGELLFVQGIKYTSMYIILKGNALVVAKILGKNMLNLATLEEGDFFGEVSLIQKIPCTATLIANTEVHCLELTAEYFDTLAMFYPEIRYKIIRAIIEKACASLNDLYKKILEIIKKSEMSAKPFPNKIITKKKEIKSELTTFDEAKLNKDDFYQSDIFESYTNEELDLLLDSSELIKVSKDVVLIKSDEALSSYFIIIRGAVQLKINYHNKNAKIAVLSPISIFSSTSNIIENSNVVNYVSCERAILLKIPIDKMKLIEKSNKPLWYKLSDSICVSYVDLELAANKLLIRLNSELYNR